MEQKIGKNGNITLTYKDEDNLRVKLKVKNGETVVRTKTEFGDKCKFRYGSHSCRETEAWYIQNHVAPYAQQGRRAEAVLKYARAKMDWQRMTPQQRWEIVKRKHIQVNVCREVDLLH